VWGPRGGIGSAMLFNANATAFVPGGKVAANTTCGVTVETICAGDGTTFPKKGDQVTVHYEGAKHIYIVFFAHDQGFGMFDLPVTSIGTLDKHGSKFDSSRDRHIPFIFQIGVGQVCDGGTT